MFNFKVITTEMYLEPCKNDKRLLAAQQTFILAKTTLRRLQRNNFLNSKTS